VSPRALEHAASTVGDFTWMLSQMFLCQGSHGAVRILGFNTICDLEL